MQATNMRWGGLIFKSSLPYLVSNPNTVIDANDSHSKLQNAKVSNKSGLKEESSEILFYHKGSTTLSKFPKMMQHKSEQPIWDEKGWALEVCNPILCHCPIQLLATFDSHTMLPSRIVRTKFGVEEKSCKIYLSCNRLDIDVKPVHFHWKGRENRNNNKIRQHGKQYYNTRIKCPCHWFKPHSPPSSPPPLPILQWQLCISKIKTIDRNKPIPPVYPPPLPQPLFVLHSRRCRCSCRHHPH